MRSRTFLLISLLAAAACAALAGCPGADKPGKAGSAGTSGAASAEYPPAALDYLAAALKSPTEDYPALGYSWGVVAQLTALPDDGAGKAIRAEIAAQVLQAGAKPPPELVAAWLATHPTDAQAWLEEQWAAGNWQYISALWWQRELAHRTFGEKGARRVKPEQLNRDAVNRWLTLIRFWGGPEPRDEDLLTAISNRTGEPENSLRASGFLLMLFPEDTVLLDYVDNALRSAGPSDAKVLSGAAEAVRMSGNPRFTAPLVRMLSPMVVQDGQLKPEVSTVQLYAAYALAYLPGEEARLMRAKLLESADNGLIKWQARLGEFLHGNPEPWNAGVQEEGLASADLWMALDAVDPPRMELLPVLLEAAGSPEAELQLRALRHLERYGALIERAAIVELVTKLTGADVEAVREAAWYCAAKLGLTEMQPLPVLADSRETPRVRMAAAAAALLSAQRGKPSRPAQADDRPAPAEPKAEPMGDTGDPAAPQAADAAEVAP